MNISKQLHLLCGVALAAAATACSHDTDSYRLEGRISGADGSTIYLTVMDADSMRIDSTVIDNGQFTFTGTAPETVDATLHLTHTTVIPLVLEPGTVTVSGLTASDFSKGRIGGTTTNIALSEFFEQVMPLREKIHSIECGMDTISAVGRDSLRAVIDSLERIHIGLILENIKRNPGSLYFARNLDFMIDKVDNADLKDVFNALSPEVQAKLPNVRNVVESNLSAEPGRPAPELRGINHEGKPERLSDLKGNVVLLDFWSTSCGPCRAYFPHLHELYEKYNGKGFEVFCVAYNSLNPDVWQKFITESKHGLTDFHHILSESTDKDDKDFGIDRSIPYHVKKLPTKYLIDRDGNIIGLFETADEIDAKLAEIFGE